MAIAFGAISSVSTAQNGFNSVSVSGSNTIGIICVAGDDSGDNITAVTWGGVGMTKVTAVRVPGDRWISVWWVANPSSAGAIAFTGGSFWRSFNMYYTGAKQTGQMDSSNTGTVSANTVISVATTIVATDCWLVMFQKDVSGGKTYSASNAISTMRANADAGGIAIADSNASASTGSQTATLTASGNSDHGAIAFSIAPVQTTTIKTWDGIARANLKTLDGVASANIKSINGIL